MEDKYSLTWQPWSYEFKYWKKVYFYFWIKFMFYFKTGRSKFERRIQIGTNLPTCVFYFFDLIAGKYSVYYSN